MVHSLPSIYTFFLNLKRCVSWVTPFFKGLIHKLIHKWISANFWFSTLAFTLALRVKSHYSEVAEVVHDIQIELVSTSNVARGVAIFFVFTNVRRTELSTRVNNNRIVVDSNCIFYLHLFFIWHCHSWAHLHLVCQSWIVFATALDWLRDIKIFRGRAEHLTSLA